VAIDCEHYDSELDCCKKFSDWSEPMPVLEPCLEPCKHKELRKDVCWYCASCRTQHDLDPDTDFHSSTVGDVERGYSIMYSCGFHQGPRIEMRAWNDKINMWDTVGIYKPKYCPECGRHITEWSDKE